MSRNPDWYVQNSVRSYPLDDAATLTDDLGNLLPHHIITDLNLRFPETAGRYAYVGGVTVTEKLVTVTIVASEYPAVPSGSPTAFTPLAAVTLPKPIVVGRPYPVDAQYPGVGGWIVFGSGTEENYSGRFATVQQSMLTPKTAKSYAVLPTVSIGKLYHKQVLTGVVRLKGGNDLEIVKAVKRIAGVDREAIVFRLVNTTSDNTRNVLDIYKGPCGRRPESLNCGDPEPIQNINGVSPDCCGVITLQLQGCLDVAVADDLTAAVLNCDIGLIDVCDLDDFIPSPDGTLPNRPGDDCA